MECFAETFIIGCWWTVLDWCESCVFSWASKIPFVNWFRLEFFRLLYSVLLKFKFNVMSASGSKATQRNSGCLLMVVSTLAFADVLRQFSSILLGFILCESSRCYSFSLSSYYLNMGMFRLLVVSAWILAGGCGILQKQHVEQFAAYLNCVMLWILYVISVIITPLHTVLRAVNICH